MERLRDIILNPSGFDSEKNFMGMVPDSEWLYVIGRNRDSDPLTESNFRSALKLLEGESENVQIFEYGHWACGWVKYIGVKENTPQAKIASDLLDKLEAYPVVDEQDWSELEEEYAQDTWNKCYSLKEKVDLCKEYGASIFAARHDYYPEELYEYLRTF